MEPLLSLIVGFLGLGTLVAFLSPFVVRLIVLLYPEDSPRRAEFVSEIEEVPVTGRVTYLAGVLATAICEATPERLNFAVRDLTLIRRAARVDRAEMESKGLNEGFAAAADQASS